MKKGIVSIIISTLIIITVSLWILNTSKKIEFVDALSFVVIFIVVLFGIVVGLSRIKSVKLGQPAEDELSKKLLQKASSTSYYISLYLWLVIIYVSDKIKAETHTFISAGILAMAITFVLSWVFFKIFGLKDV